jgi:hypothetical protein
VVGEEAVYAGWCEERKREVDEEGKVDESEMNARRNALRYVPFLRSSTDGGPYHIAANFGVTQKASDTGTIGAVRPTSLEKATRLPRHEPQR